MLPILLVAALTAHFLHAEESPDTLRVRRVYENLVRVASDGRRPPNLLIRQDGDNSGGFRAAKYDQRKRQISIDQRVVGYCLAKAHPHDDSCLAFLLGHELAHFYKDHGWGMDFPAGFSGTPERESALTAAQLSALEAQADQAGGLYAHMAGYAALPLVPQILTDIYQLYGIEDRIPGYPSLDERKQIAIRADAALNRMTAVFDLGLLLFLLDRHEEASRCFDWVAQSFPSREILNNAALAKALAAAALFPAQRHALQYPWTLDGESRLTAKPEPRRGEDVEAPADRRLRLLAEAKAGFIDALSKDGDYPVSLFNLALVEDLRGEFGSAADHLRQGCMVASHVRAEIPPELCREARTIIAANSTTQRPWPGPSVSPLPTRDPGPILSGLLDPTSVRFPSDSRETIVIPPASDRAAAMNIECKRTSGFTALRLRTGTEKLLVLDGPADSSPLTGDFASLKQMPDGKQRTASGFIRVYAASHLFVFCDRQSRMVRWMRFQWVD